MSLHQSTFEYMKPTDKQVFQMEEVREHFRSFADMLQPTGDRTLHRAETLALHTHTPHCETTILLVGET